MVTVYDKDGHPMEVDNPAAFVAGSVDPAHGAPINVTPTLAPPDVKHPGLGEPGGPVEPTAGQLAVAAKRVLPGTPGTRWNPLTRQWTRIADSKPVEHQIVERPGPSSPVPANPAPTSAGRINEPASSGGMVPRFTPGPVAPAPSPATPATQVAIAAPHRGTLGSRFGAGSVAAPVAPSTAGKTFVRRGYTLPVKTRIHPNPRAPK